MTDGIIKGTGNSRYIKTVANAMALYPTYEQFMEAFVAGEIPIDLNGINPSGWEQQGTALTKSNLLTDTLCTALGLETTATPTEAMEKLRANIADVLTQVSLKGNCKIATGSYIGNNTHGSGNKNTLTFSFAPSVIILHNSKYITLSTLINPGYYLPVLGVSYSKVIVSWTQNSVSWYSDDGAAAQFNTPEQNYYVAFG